VHFFKCKLHKCKTALKTCNLEKYIKMQCCAQYAQTNKFECHIIRWCPTQCKLQDGTYHNHITGWHPLQLHYRMVSITATLQDGTHHIAITVLHYFRCNVTVKADKKNLQKNENNSLFCLTFFSSCILGNV